MSRGRGRPKKLPPTDRDVVVRQFDGACLPVLLVDLELNVTYANVYARDTFPTMELPDGLRAMLPADSVEECRKRILRGENFRTDLSPLKAAKVALAFTPFSNSESEGKPTGALVLVTYTEDHMTEMEIISQSGTAALSNSMRRPLSEIFATLAVMGRKFHVNEDRQYDRYLTDINRAAYQILRNTNNIVNHLRACSEYRTLTEVVDFWDRMAELLEACAVMLHTSDIPFTYDLPRERVHVACNFNEIAEAVVNLVSNSYRYTRPGNQVHISGKNTANTVMVNVCDKGKGIHPDQLDMIFSPYYSRGDGGEPFVGLGMGLNVARENIYRNGGTLAVNSNLRDGTSIGFTLPTTELPLTPRATVESGSALYLRDRFSPVYVGLCDIVDPPEQ